MIALGGLRLSQVHDGRCLPAPTTRRPGRASRPTRCAQPQPLEKYRLPTFTALCRNFAASKCSPIRCNSCTAPLKQAVYGSENPQATRFLDTCRRSSAWLEPICMSDPMCCVLQDRPRGARVTVLPVTPARAPRQISTLL